ncbi:MAG: hypothetical protein AB1424_14795 [Thermodesulfobacteriota bacterium]
MKLFSWKVWLGLSLLWVSAMVYGIHYLLFRDVNYMLRLFFAQLGFLPINVLIVTIIINQLLGVHAKRAKLAKLNMVIGAFFSEVGQDLLKSISSFTTGPDHFSSLIKNIDQWPDQGFASFRKALPGYDFDLRLEEVKLEFLQSFLADKRDFLLRLLENPNLLEHDAFSNLLLAVFHLAEELAQREELQHLSPGDQEHLTGDLQRVFILLIDSWLDYMEHLKNHYPYLFSLAVRTNPFDPQATVEIR